MRKDLLYGEERTLEMLVTPFDWLDGLGPQPTAQNTHLYEVSQVLEAIITDTLAQMDQAATMIVSQKSL